MECYEPVTITFELSTMPTLDDLDLYRGVYEYRDEASGEAYDVYYIPDFEELKTGRLSFNTYHFSEYELKKLTQDEAYKYAAHLRAVEKYTFSSGIESAYVNKVTENLVDSVVQTLDLDDSAMSGKLQFALSNTGNMYTISKANRNGDSETTISTITDVIVRTFVKEADSKIPGLSYLEATAGTIPKVWDDIVNKGDTNAARLAVAEAIEAIFKNNRMDADNVFHSYMFKTQADRIANTNDKYAELVLIWDTADSDYAGRKAVLQYIEEHYMNAELSRDKVEIPIRRSYKLVLYGMDREEITSGVTYTSGNEEIATVDSDGLIKGISMGSTTVTADYAGNTYNCMVSVTEGDVEPQQDISLYILGTTKLNAYGLADWTKTTDIKWYTNSSLVSIDGEGNLTAGANPGTGKVYAYLKGEDRLLVWNVEVKDVTLSVSNTQLDIEDYTYIRIDGWNPRMSEEGIDWTIDEEMLHITETTPASCYVRAQCIGVTTVKVYIHQLERELSQKIRITGTPRIQYKRNRIGDVYTVFSLEHVKSDAGVVWSVQQPDEYVDFEEDPNGNGIIVTKTAKAYSSLSSVQFDELNIVVTVSYGGFTYYRTITSNDL
ncbi:MAG: Ig-like domain-containing protein [Lachnospiraceae bacterium]|nr:Ig-like domain-containing protein [Lachnospiraceae bacterium]